MLAKNVLPLAIIIDNLHFIPDFSVDGVSHNYTSSVSVTAGNITVSHGSHYDTYDVDIGDDITVVVVRKTSPKVGGFMGVHVMRSDSLSTDTGGIIGECISG